MDIVDLHIYELFVAMYYSLITIKRNCSLKMYIVFVILYKKIYLAAKKSVYFRAISNF